MRPISPHRISTSTPTGSRPDGVPVVEGAERRVIPVGATSARAVAVHRSTGAAAGGAGTGAGAGAGGRDRVQPAAPTAPRTTTTATAATVVDTTVRRRDRLGRPAAGVASRSPTATGSG